MPNLYIFANIMLHTLTPGTPGPLTYILKYIIFTVSKIPFIPPLHGITEHQSWTEYGLSFVKFHLKQMILEAKS